jgi:hypothetical protein
VLLEVSEPDAERDRVVAALFPELHDLRAQPAGVVHLGIAELGRHEVVGAIHEKRAVRARSRHLEAVPGADLCDVRIAELELAMHEIEHRLMRVAHDVIADDVGLRLPVRISE